MRENGRGKRERRRKNRVRNTGRKEEEERGETGAVIGFQSGVGGEIF